MTLPLLETEIGSLHFQALVWTFPHRSHHHIPFRANAGSHTDDQSDVFEKDAVLCEVLVDKETDDAGNALTDLDEGLLMSSVRTCGRERTSKRRDSCNALSRS